MKKLSWWGGYGDGYGAGEAKTIPAPYPSSFLRVLPIPAPYPVKAGIPRVDWVGGGRIPTAMDLIVIPTIRLLITIS
ncbi:unnamed protein product [Linum trigynum]|uniref:Uncharacterized protein n=1 Tax=Linum trigynum TaxID=586398 RepID=A0AAV2CM73_9ROSI